MSFDEFNRTYDDWTTCDSLEIRKTHVVKDMFRCVEEKYPDTGREERDSQFNRLYNKAIVAQQKLIMMMFAEYHLRRAKADFETTQNMEFPALYGMGYTELLFYFESMIVFARNALDVVTAVYSDLLFNRREDCCVAQKREGL